MSITNDLADAVLASAEKLSQTVGKLEFAGTVASVYNPLEYAWEPYADYVKKYASTPKQVLFLGMNPGPWGMAQVGIPFGEVNVVNDWLRIKGEIGKPPVEHPKRPIEGFACKRSEVSGRRLWGLFKERFDTADSFAETHFVSNYCPLVFMEASGRNLTPDKMSAADQEPLFKACDLHLREVVEILNVEWVVGVGKFAMGRADKALKDSPNSRKLDWILHPSPASPAANKDWAGFAERKLIEIGIWEKR